MRDYDVKMPNFTCNGGEIMGFVGIFWKNNIWKAYLPETSIVGQIVLEILVPFRSDNSVQILLNLTRLLML